MLTFTLKQKKTRRAPPNAPHPTPASSNGLAQLGTFSQAPGAADLRARPTAAALPRANPKVESQGAPRTEPPGELAGLPCRARSDPQLQPDPGPRPVAGLKIVLSRAGILGMSLRGSIWLASGWQEGSNLFRVILHKILPIPRAAALGSGSLRN